MMDPRLGHREAIDRLLLCCARRELDAGTQEDVRALLAGGVDWGALLAAATRHNLLPLLRHRFHELGVAVPTEVRTALQTAYYRYLLESDRLRADLGELVGALHEQGVETLVLKGGALGTALYPRPALRPMGDLDLLIRREAIGPARAVLERLGYRPSTALPAEAGDFPWFQGGEVEYVRADEKGRATTIDLHWHVVTVAWYRYASALDIDALWERSRPLDLGRVAARQLSPEDTLIHLCLHLAIQHGYECLLLHYADIDWLAGSGALDWPCVVHRASCFRARAPVYWGLALARRRLGTEVPADALRALRPSAHRRRPVERLLARQERTPGGDKSVARNRLLRLALIDSPAGAARMVYRTLFPSREWLAARYGDDGRYRLLHPWRVIQALARGVLRNVEPIGIFYVRK